MTDRKTLEDHLWYWLRDSCTADFELMSQGLMMGRLENSLSKSWPDTEGYLRGNGQFWLELKSATRPAKRNTPVRFKFQDGQSSWLSRRWKLGGNAYLLCQVGSGAAARRYLFQGNNAVEVENGVEEDRLAAISCLPGNCTGPQIIRRAAMNMTLRSAHIYKE